MTHLAHHAGTAGPSVWDTPWPHAGLVVLVLLLVGVPWLYRALEPDPSRGYRGRHRYGGVLSRRGDLEAAPVPLPIVVFVPELPRAPTIVDGPPGRHYVGWPARHARQIVEDTGEWAVDDLADALYDVEIDLQFARELTAGGAR